MDVDNQDHLFTKKNRNSTFFFLPMYAKRWSLKHHFQAVGLDGIKLVLQVCQLLRLPLLFDVMMICVAKDDVNNSLPDVEVRPNGVSGH